MIRYLTNDLITGIMAGYSIIYCVGGLGGFEGADGINPILFQILIGDADRQWAEAHYFDKSIKPLGKIKTIIPEKPNDKYMLLDACITFFPNHFENCPTLEKIRKKLSTVDRLDFNVGKDKIPGEWEQLRKEALPFFKRLNIFEAKLIRLNL